VRLAKPFEEFRSLKSALYPSVITHVETLNPFAALTFDDGPHPVYTPRILTILEQHGARATFFMVGEAASRYPEIVRMVDRGGHVIGNHCWNHLYLPGIRSRLRRLRQLWACARATAPYSSRLFRPPYGAHNDQIRFDTLIFRYKLILWSASAQDWIPQEPEEIAQKIIDRVVPGSIFLLHDGMYPSPDKETEPAIQWDRKPMLKGLAKALTVLKGKIHFVTVPELLQTGRPVSNWPR
jgi:peptidoglycan/xylan/chitin deacetylase (PgdA/CDA1 family)